MCKVILQKSLDGLGQARGHKTSTTKRGRA
jgi:hypothetical protein